MGLRILSRVLTGFSCLLIVGGFAFLLVLTPNDEQPAQYRATHEPGEAADNPRGAAEWIREQRAFPLKNIPTQAYARALSERAQFLATQQQRLSAFIAPGSSPSTGGGTAPSAADPMTTLLAGFGGWSSIGPAPITSGSSTYSGRITAIQMCDANRAYIGTANGGVWKTTDSGATWTAMSDEQASLAIGSIAVVCNTSTTDVVYAGTGEGDYSLDSYYGAGILKSTDGGSTWTVLAGPAAYPFGGASVTHIVVNPITSTTVIVGLNSGNGFSYPSVRNTGIARSTDAGATWTRSSIAPCGACGLDINDILIDSTGNTLYASVSYAFGQAYNGVYKSTDGGINFSLVTNTGAVLPTGTAMGRTTLGMDPATPNTVYASVGATSGYLTNVYKTTDGGNNWTALFPALHAASLTMSETESNNTAGTANAISLDEDVTTASVGTISDVDYYSFTLGSQKTVTATVVLGTLPYSTLTLYDSSGTNQLAFSQFVGFTNASQITRVLNAGTYYLKVGSYASSYSGTYQLQLREGTPGLEAGYHKADQWWYDNFTKVKPGDPNTVYIGGVDVFRATDGGVNANSWTNLTQAYDSPGVTPYIHPDQHAMAFAPGSLNTIFLGNDGGMYRTTDAWSTWGAINSGGLSLTQFYGGGAGSGAGTPLLAGGTQDNGTPKYSGSAAWARLLGGDGGYVAIDPANQDSVFGEFYGISMWHTSNATAASPTFTRNLYSGINTADRSAFIVPFTMDPNNGTILYTGTYRLYRTTNSASTWTAIGGDLTGGVTTAYVTAMAVAKSHSDTVYVGTKNGKVWQITNASAVTPTVTDRSTGLPGRWVTHIAVDPTNDQIAYVAYSGFNYAAAPSGHLFKTTNGGATWVDVSSTLPDVPFTSVAIDPASPQMLYVGTDAGLYVSEDSGASWWTMDTGLPNTGIYDLVVGAGNGKLYAFTHGRGTWEAVRPVAPTITSLSVSSGSTAGGTSVIVTGTGFLTSPGAMDIRFGANSAQTMSCSSSTTCNVTSPPGVAGIVHVTAVITAGLTSATTAADQFTYVAAPTVTLLSPTSGPVTGGTSVTVTGTGFSTNAANDSVMFGSTSGTVSACASTTSCTVTSPAVTTAGPVYVTMTVLGVTSATGAGNQFTYLPVVSSLSQTSGPVTGGTTLTVTGAGFSTTPGATAISFGASAATGVSCTSATSCTATSPAGAVGAVYVTATVAGATSATGAGNQFAYLPVVSSLSPASGPAAGGTVVSVTGAGFSTAPSATAINFGSTAASSVSCSSSTSCTATSPAGTGVVDVTAVVGGQTSQASSLDQFTYLFTLSGTVRNAAGAAVAGVSVQPYAGTSCCTYITQSITDASGNYSLSLAADSYRLFLNPGAGSPYPAQWYGGSTFAGATAVTLSANTTVNITLN